MPKPTLQVIVASTRPRRVGPAVADYLVRRIGERGGFEIELLDLAEIDLPLLDEPHHPRLGRYEHAHTKAWSAEWVGKPVALASYGGISGGTRAAAALTEVLITLGLIVSRAAVAIPMVQTHITDGRFTGYPAVDQAIDALYGSLVDLTAKTALTRS